MDAAVIVVISAMIGTAAMLVWAADRAERRWRRRHPPDDADGMREERFNDD